MVGLGCTESVGTDWIFASIAHYQQVPPAVQFQIVSGVTANLVASLLQDTSDLILVHDPLPSDQLKIMASVRKPLCVMVQAGPALASLPALRLTDCQNNR